MADPVAPDGRVLADIAAEIGQPATVAQWKAAVDGLLSDPCCAFHRNVEISAWYAWLARLQPASFKWAAMAALASHHVRLVLFPFRFDADRTGYVDLERSARRSRTLLLDDVNTIRATNNAIFDDIFWVHLAYASDDDGIGQLRAVLQGDDTYAPLLSGFESIDDGCRIPDQELVWVGNVRLLEHEQRALVQPHFDHLSCRFARLISLGAATTFGVRGARHEAAYFTSFYTYALGPGRKEAWQARTWPRLTRFDDRWRWLECSVVPHFRRLDADPRLVEASLRRIVEDAAVHASAPCLPPRI